MIDRRLIQNFDWLLLLLTFAIMTVGLATLYSALFSGGEVQSAVIKRQLYWLGTGAVVMILAFSIDYQWFERFAYPAYVIGLLLLLAVLIFGKTVSGSKRWLDFGWWLRSLAMFWGQLCIGLFFQSVRSDLSCMTIYFQHGGTD